LTDKITRIVVLIFLILLAIYVYSQAANAEEHIQPDESWVYYEQLIKFPIPLNNTGMSHLCSLNSINDDQMFVTCQWIINFDKDGKKWYDDLQAEEGVKPPQDTVCPERFYLDEDGVTCYPIYDTPKIPGLVGEIPPPLKRFIADRDRFDEDPPRKISEKDYYEKLKFLQMCYRQTETNQQSLGVTQTDGFAVSNLWIEDFGIFLKSYDLTGSHAVLDKAIEECKYIHTILNPVTLGAEYQNRAQFFNTTQAYHGDLARDVPVWTQNRVNEEENQGIDTTKNYCDEVQHLGLETKRYLGCVMESDVDKPISKKRLQEMCNSSYVMAGFKRSNGCTVEQIAIPCNACEQHSPIYESPAMQKYHQYSIDDGEAMYKELQQQALQERVRQLLK